MQDRSSLNLTLIQDCNEILLLKVEATISTCTGVKWNNKRQREFCEVTTYCSFMFRPIKWCPPASCFQLYPISWLKWIWHFQTVFIYFILITKNSFNMQLKAEKSLCLQYTTVHSKLKHSGVSHHDDVKHNNKRLHNEVIPYVQLWLHATYLLVLVENIMWGSLSIFILFQVSVCSLLLPYILESTVLCMR